MTLPRITRRTGLEILLVLGLVGLVVTAGLPDVSATQALFGVFLWGLGLTFVLELTGALLALGALAIAVALRLTIVDGGLSDIALWDGVLVLGAAATLAIGGAKLAGTSRLLRQMRQALEEVSEHRQQRERMAALGRFAAGVAHDFNNILMAIGGNIELARLDPSNEARELLEEIERASDRGASLVRGLLGFAKKRNLDREPIAPMRLIADACIGLNHRLGHEVTLRMTVPRDLPRVMAEPRLVEQVLVDLGLHARDALNAVASSDRLITLGAEKAAPASAPRRDTVVCASREDTVWVRFFVRDTGTRVPPELQGQIFEPFFARGHAAVNPPLGLATAYAWVEEHGGWFEVSDDPAGATELAFFLPGPGGHPHRAALGKNKVSHVPLELRVLIVDDEETVRHVTQQLLEAAGCGVVTATNGTEALEALDDQDEAIDVILLDLTLPGFSGQATLAELRRRGHLQPVLIASGPLAPERRQALSEFGIAGVLAKPFRGEALVNAVRQVADTATPYAQAG